MSPEIAKNSVKKKAKKKRTAKKSRSPKKAAKKKPAKKPAKKSGPLVLRRIRESREMKRKRVSEIMSRLHKAHPDAKCALTYSNPLELLLATILSAQCTDERVNKVTQLV